MATIISLKKNLQFNKELSGLIEALKAIAVTRFRIWERKLRTFEKFHNAIGEFLSLIDPTGLNHPFVNPRSKSFFIVGITSDSGLLGALNLQVVSACLEELERHAGQLIILGERGQMHLKGLDIPHISFPGVIEERRFLQAMRLKELLLKNILLGKAGGLTVIYPRALSITVQRIEIVHLLPYRPPPKSPQTRSVLKYLIKESFTEDIVNYLIDLRLFRKLYEVMGLSKLAEFAARVVHLEESSQKLKDIDKQARLKYFRARHEMIDRSMRELFAARSLYT